MTLEEFYSELSHIHGWSLNKVNDFFPRAVRRYHDGRTYCPITAVCARKTGEIYSVQEFPSAARKLGLDRDDSNKIVSAADNDPLQISVIPGSSFKLDRDKLLEACHLKDK